MRTSDHSKYKTVQSYEKLELARVRYVDGMGNDETSLLAANEQGEVYVVGSADKMLQPASPWLVREIEKARVPPEEAK